MTDRPGVDGSSVVVLRGGRVLPPPGGAGQDRHAWPTALALGGGRILAVGDDDDVTAHARHHARADGAFGAEAVDVVELDGRLVVPGFVDAHAHPVTGGLERLRCDLTATVEPAEALAAIARHRERHALGPGGWLLGGGWSLETFPGGCPRADVLDALLGDVPVFLPNRDHHSAWVSTAALRLAGITAATADPPGGRLERDPDGSPSGTLHEAAMDLVGDVVPAPSDAELDAALVEAQRHLLSLGVTGWQDAILGSYAGMVDATGVYLRAQAAGWLQVRVAGALWWPRGLSVDDVPAQAAMLAARARSIAEVGERLTAPTVKIMLDGVTESFTAAMHEPYLAGPDGAGPDAAPGVADHGTGLTYLDEDLLHRVVAECASRGFGVHVHAIGDRAVTWALEAIAAAAASRRPTAAHASAPRQAAPHQVAHLQVVREDDVALWAASGAYANCQALWACHEPQMDELNLPYLGERRSRRQYPFAQLRAAGVPLAMGSDWPVSSADPLAAVHVAVNRRTAGSGSPAFLPGQAIGLLDALHAYTAGSAAACGWAGTTGELRPGQDADVVVLSRDPFVGSAEEISDTVVDLTYARGVPAWERPAGGR